MKTSVKFLICSAVAAVTAFGAFAQPAKQQQDDRKKNREEWKEKFQNERIAFLTKEIDLTVEEAQAFWPVYNQVQNEKRDAFKDVTASFSALKDALNEGKTGKEIEVLLNAYLAAKEDNDALDRQSVAQYRKVIPEEKIAKLFIAEEKFRNQQIRRLDRGREGQGPGGQRPGGFRPGMGGGERGGWQQRDMNQD